jgi:hypothetical protein
MGGDVAARRAQQRERGLRIRHARIMQEQHVRLHAVPALTMVRRGSDLGHQGGIGTKFGHKQNHTRDRRFAGTGVTLHKTKIVAAEWAICAETTSRDKRGGPPAPCAATDLPKLLQSGRTSKPAFIRTTLTADGPDRCNRSGP